jgi:sensory rhodopsin
MIGTLAGLQQLVAFTFILTFFGMSAASIFLLLERHGVDPSFRLSVTMAGVICGIAAGNYFFMRGIYIDGFLTVPLMLAQFPMHLGLGKKGQAFMLRLVVLSLVMLTLGYIGEVNPSRPALQVTMWTLGCVAGGTIFLPLGTALRHLPDHVSSASARTVKAMAALTLIGWLVYPLGYLQPLIGFAPDVRELVYNVADLVNKVGLGAVIFWGGRLALRPEARTGSSDRAPAEALIGPSATDRLLGGL